MINSRAAATDMTDQEASPSSVERHTKKLNKIYGPNNASAIYKRDSATTYSRKPHPQSVSRMPSSAAAEEAALLYLETAARAVP